MSSSPRRSAQAPHRVVRRLASTALAGALLLSISACGSGPTPSPTASGSPDASATPATSPSGSPAASPSPSASTGVTSEQEQQLKAVAGEILAQVSSIRGLDLEHPVDTRVLDQAGLDAYVKKSYEKDTSAADLAAAEGIYRRLGLLSADQSLEDLQLALLSSQVLGLYDDTDKQLYVVARGASIGGLEKFTMSHELDHALQDQHFDLQKLVPEGDQLSSDVGLAHLSVAEGDATLLMSQWATQHLTPQELAETLAAAADPQQQAILEKTPAILLDPLEFPYTSGLQLVLTAWRSGGWRAVDALYGRPPASTEQVLHADKYAAAEAPVAVSLPTDLASTMGSGWTIAQTDTFGEYLISVWLRERLGASGAATATAAAAGWGGDSMAYLTGPGGADALVWSTSWDTAKDADEFLAAAGTAVGAGLGAEPAAGTVIRASDREVAVILASDGPTLDAAVKAAGFPR